jgi:hypothetical protein
VNDDYADITAIVANFAEGIDTHDWIGIGELFSHLTYTSPGIDYEVSGVSELAAFYERVTTEMNVRWAGDPDDGKTVGHKHVFTNLVVEVADDRRTATCRYYGTVYAYSSKKPLQPRWSGRYYDRFERIDDRWHIVARRQETDFPQGYKPSE